MRIFSTITSQNQKWHTTVLFKLCSRCASLRIILNIPYTEQELIHTSSQKPWMSSFFLLRLDYVCNLTSKTKSFKMWMLQRWLPVINCPRQLETNTSSAGQREGTTLSPSLSMQIYSTIYYLCKYSTSAPTASPLFKHPPSSLSFYFYYSKCGKILCCSSKWK